MSQADPHDKVEILPPVEFTFVAPIEKQHPDKKMISSTEVTKNDMQIVFKLITSDLGSSIRHWQRINKVRGGWRQPAAPVVTRITVRNEDRAQTCGPCGKPARLSSPDNFFNENRAQTCGPCGKPARISSPDNFCNGFFLAQTTYHTEPASDLTGYVLCPVSRQGVTLEVI